MTETEPTGVPAAVVTVLGGLLNTAPPDARKVLGAYSWLANHIPNKKKMLKCNARKELEPCALFLGIKVRDDEDKKLYKNMSVLVDRVILKIESLFETQCEDCNEKYTNSLEDDSPFTCKLCMQGSHNCQILLDRKKFYEDAHENAPLGCVWICYGCQEKNNLSMLLPGQTPSEEDSEKEDPAPEETVTEETESRVSPRRDKAAGQNTKTNAEKTVTDKTTKDTTNATNSHRKICEKNKRRACPHGLMGRKEIDGKLCPDLHPKRCRRYCGHRNDKKRGCRYGKDCKFFHPRLCINSLKDKV